MKTVLLSFKIIPVNVCGKCKTGELNNVTVDDIVETLGFAPNLGPSSDGKVNNEWGFSISNTNFGIWDYKGSEKHNTFSTYGDPTVFKSLFGGNYTTTHEHRPFNYFKTGA